MHSSICNCDSIPNLQLKIRNCRISPVRTRKFTAKTITLWSINSILSGEIIFEPPRYIFDHLVSCRAISLLDLTVSSCIEQFEQQLKRIVSCFALCTVPDLRHADDRRRTEAPLPAQPGGTHLRSTPALPGYRLHLHDRAQSRRRRKAQLNSPFRQLQRHPW